MAKYIKSHSNYVLKTKHQDTSNGVIYERDITTIGGKDQFSKGQVPIYKTGNFIITINNDNTIFRKLSNKDWYRNDAGNIWTSEILKYYEKDEKTSFDEKISIKNDFYDLRDYAYYGSCSELIRASINDILKTYPGELFVPTQVIYEGEGGEIQYTEEAAKSAFGGAYDRKVIGIYDYYKSYDDNKRPLSAETKHLEPQTPSTAEVKEKLENNIPYTRKYKMVIDGNVYDDPDLVLMDNPFKINIHNRFVPKGADPLKYFADGGVENYVGYKKDESGEWIIDTDHEYSISVVSIVLEGVGETSEETITFETSSKGNCGDGGNCTDEFIKLAISAFSNTEISGEADITCLKPGTYLGYVELGFSKNSYQFFTNPSSKSNKENCEVDKIKCDDNGNCIQLESDEASGATISVYSNTSNAPSDFLKVYMFVDNDYNVKYFVENKEKNFQYRIRPSRKIINDYFTNKLDSFEKILLNRDSSPIYSAMFEIVDENDYGYYTNIKTFTFPTTYGGYNLGSTSPAFLEYVNSLSKIGSFYDERFSDNLWRSMTHEAIKNFDWTYTRHYNSGEEEPFIEGGIKTQKIIRLFGREFDEIKNYINSISSNNTVTYNNVENLPDYFFTDKLETEGWDLTPVFPLILTEYVNDYELVPVDFDKMFCEKYFEDGTTGTTADAEKNNYFYDSEKLDNKINIRRVFTQYLDNFYVTPYTKKQITNIRETTYTGATGETTGFVFDLPETDGKSCFVDGFSVGVTAKKGEYVADGYHDACGNLIRLYTDEKKYTPADVNTEFFKRLIINSRDIWKHKGTIEGMEMILSMFGLRSKKNFYSNERYFKHVKNKNGSCSLELTTAGKEYYTKYSGQFNKLYDYDIKEYTMFTTPLKDEFLTDKNMFKIDWINSLKLVSYNKNREYITYQGLPLSYSAHTATNENTGEEFVDYRQLFPHFESKGLYDGGLYYQMNGGWLQKRPFAFDLKNNIVMESETSNSKKSDALFTETVRNIKCVNTIADLLTNKTLATNSGDIIQVLDLSGEYAIVDGITYPLQYEDYENGETSNNRYFSVQVKNNSVIIGKAYFNDYVVISNPYSTNNKKRIDLNDGYYNNKSLKIYVIGDDENGYTIDAYSNTATISTFTIFKDGKYSNNKHDNYTNYFKLNNPDFSSELSILGWQQLRDNEYEYYKVNMIENYNKGNNPHLGHLKYDNGHEYLKYFKHIFKYTADNNLIDYRKLYDDDYDDLDEYEFLGFKNLINDDECDIDYDKYLRIDSKCHFFGNLWQNGNEGEASITNESGKTIEYINCFGKRNLPTEKTEYSITDVTRYNYIDDSNPFSIKKITPDRMAVSASTVDVGTAPIDSVDTPLTPMKTTSISAPAQIKRGLSFNAVSGITPSVYTTSFKITNVQYGDVNKSLLSEEGEYDKEEINNKVTDQIMNTKRMDIDFYIKNSNEYSKEWLEEIKYIDSVVLPYLTQMMPSGVICRINYKSK